jgi:WD40 repeat protein
MPKPITVGALPTTTWRESTFAKKVALPPSSDAHGNSQYAMSLTFSPDGRILAAGGWEDVVRLWDISETK